ncbi:hypothetical protein JHK82_042644 [Glycine max]|uniref:DUF7086 domain-containing protein n=2 Tax=Glycine subgen. Soja TaxID=1462606 RepID=K7MC27_SOYBN|nr:hypothetical protein JHK87_042571 [Glycine soja]KAG4949433.1 hypothetical protein JHK86_042672 [Glycine max]KAG4956917.1 hypothetical protein JHK85_043297 [Glycine max]KAG5105674.1 hypothetical protein JHK82_042644 [Glycine max]KAG5116779.1 hypothetical protein JHK84_042892 [Glycine max]
MDNFFRAAGMKNAMDLEDHEHDLTLALRCGSPERTTHSSSPSLPQINISLMELQMPYPNYLVPFSNHNIDPLLVSCSKLNINPSLVSSSNNNTDHPLLAMSPSNPAGAAAPTPVLRRRPRRASSQRRRRSQGKSETIPAPFPWATDRRATVHNREYLLQNNVIAITGRVQCGRCGYEFEMTLDLEEKVNELSKFIRKKRRSMHDRAPAAWVNPVMLKCVYCGRENCTKPTLLYTKKREINWLFLLLGQMLGFCTIEQLRYFCKHTNNHRTGAKDRLLYAAYMTLSKQLVPEWFD